MNVFFIQNACGSARSKMNSIPLSGLRLNRCISPVERSSGVAATSAVIFWSLTVRVVVGSGAAAWDGDTARGSIATPNISNAPRNTEE